ncbi:MAG: aldolase/citrate lyase family protein [Alphaproteobacteria bacterium]
MAKAKGRAKRRDAFWLLGASITACEVAKGLGFDTLVMDMEHGVWTHESADKVIVIGRSLGLEVWARVMAPTRIAIQHVLDSGAAGVIIPHIDGLDHAREVAGYAKYPPTGTRSVGGGRTWNWGGPWQGWVGDENRRVKCFPMVETAEALADVDAILKLATVDGIFVGPFDLGMARGRGGFSGSKADLDDIITVAKACAKAGKPWGMNLYGDEQFAFAHKWGLGLACIGDDVAALQIGAGQMLEGMRKAARR